MEDPNPAQDVVKIKNTNTEIPLRNLELKIFDMLGREIADYVNVVGILPGEIWEINVHNLAAGVYFFKLSGINGKSSFRIVKQ